MQIFKVLENDDVFTPAILSKVDSYICRGSVMSEELSTILR
jgi:hypothetical protein